MANRKRDDEIDYRAEGDTPPHEKDDPTNAGYDEAAHSGGAYGVLEGEGGVFGTTGGGTYPGGLHVEERPIVYEGGGEQSGKTSGARAMTKQTPGTSRLDEGASINRIPSSRLGAPAASSPMRVQRPGASGSKRPAGWRRH